MIGTICKNFHWKTWEIGYISFIPPVPPVNLESTPTNVSFLPGRNQKEMSYHFHEFCYIQNCSLQTFENWPNFGKKASNSLLMFCMAIKVIHFSTLMSNQSSTWKMTTHIKLDIT